MFITFEGPDGCGKTSQVAALVEFLTTQEIPEVRFRHVLATREPGGTRIGDEVRTILMNLTNTGMLPQTEILLFQSSRAQLVGEVIRPALLRGEIVICDRYGDSTLAYQGYGHRIELAKLRQLIDFATGGLKPDLTLLLDLDTETGLKRRLKDGGWNRLDAYDLEFHRRVRQGYLEMAAQESGRWVVIDASPSFVEVQETLRKVVLGYLINHD
jgi:dTMP kinase